MIEIETERLFLRDIQENDFEEIHAFGRDPESTRYLVAGPMNIQGAKEFIQESIDNAKEENRLKFDLAICLKKNNKLIGTCDLHINKPKHKEATIGYCLNKDYWNNGYATETAKALIKFGFRKLDIHRIRALCDTRNEASVKVLEKSGMTKEGTLREHKYQQGEWRTSHLYAILDQDFKINNPC